MSEGGSGDRGVMNTVFRFSTLAYLLVGILIWLSLLAFPDEPRINLDSSWQQSLIYAAQHNLQAGVDYIFTYGPLGQHINAIISWPDAFFTMPYEPHIFYRHVAWEIVVNAFLATVFVLILARTRGWIARLCLLVLALVVLPISKDALYLFALVAVTALLVYHYRGRYAMAGAVMIFFAVVSLMKFSLAIVAAICTLAVAAAFIRRSKAVAAATVVSYAALVALFWVMAGQSLADIPAYVATSLQITSGYSEAMANGGPLAQVMLALGVLVCATLLLALSRLGETPGFVRFVAAAAILAAFFMGWKAGFVRHDLHAFIFFAFATPALLLIPRPSSGCFSRLAFITVLYAGIVLGAVGIFASGKLMGFGYTPERAVSMWRERLAGNARTLLWPQETKALRDERWHAITDWAAMPEVDRIVDRAPVDIFSYDEQRVFLNGLNWRGRPVFHSYSAYTSELLAANGRFFEGPRAPEFVLYKAQPIDGRYPTLEDNRALEALLRGYTPVAREYGYLLFRRNASPPAPPVRENAILSERAPINRWVSIESSDTGAQVLALDIKYSALGKLREFLYKAPRVMIRVQTAGGKDFTFRMIPGMAKDGFLISPLLPPDKLAAWYLGEPLGRVVAIRIGVEPKDVKYFKPDYALELKPLGFDLPALSSEARAALQRGDVTGK